MTVPRLVEEDSYLQPYASDFLRWAEKYQLKEKELLGDISLLDFASGHDYFGLFKTEKGWVFRDWAPNATRIFIIGNFNNWQDHSDYELKSIGNGCWELEMPPAAVHHGDLWRHERTEDSQLPGWHAQRAGQHTVGGRPVRAIVTVDSMGL